MLSLRLDARYPVSWEVYDFVLQQDLPSQRSGLPLLMRSQSFASIAPSLRAIC